MESLPKRLLANWLHGRCSSSGRSASGQKKVKWLRNFHERRKQKLYPHSYDISVDELGKAARRWHTEAWQMISERNQEKQAKRVAKYSG